MQEEYKRQLYDKLFSAIWEDVVAIIEINQIEKSYHVSEGNQYVRNLFPETGTLRTLYRFLFQKGGASEKADLGEYDRFVDETVFQKDKYQGDIRFSINGEEIRLHFLLLNIVAQLSRQKSKIFIMN